MKKLLWVGDAGCPSGFARITHRVLDTLRDHYDVTVLGLNYRGDPHEYPYKIYAAAVGGDGMGVGRLVWMCDLIKPDIIVLQNDGWNIPSYVQRLNRFPQYSNIPVVASVAVDGKNFLGPWLTGVSMAVFWSSFGLAEAREGGYGGKAAVIPLGIDRTVYYPQDKAASRMKILRGFLPEAFIVGNVNRNQPRKRLDLMIRYFAEWVKSCDVKDAQLFLHVAPTGDHNGIDLTQLARYYGIIDKFILSEPQPWYGLEEEGLRDLYNCFDIYASTTQGEGFGFPALEAMACGVPCILPDWAAYSDWAKPGAWLVPCKTTAIGPPYVNVIGGIPEEGAYIKALNALYVNKEAYKRNTTAALECASDEKFSWDRIGQKWVETLAAVLEAESPAETVGVPA